MLILTRKVGESIVVGDEIEVFLTEVNRHSARIGISAPKELPVYRKEVFERIKEENKEAATAAFDIKVFDTLNQLLIQKVKK